MIDWGAAGNFIDIRFANTHNLPLVPCESRVAVAALDGLPLGTGQVKFITKDLCFRTGILHIETIRLFTIDSHHPWSALVGKTQPPNIMDN